MLLSPKKTFMEQLNLEIQFALKKKKTKLQGFVYSNHYEDKHYQRVTVDCLTLQVIVINLAQPSAINHESLTMEVSCLFLLFVNYSMQILRLFTFDQLQVVVVYKSGHKQREYCTRYLVMSLKVLDFEYVIDHHARHLSMGVVCLDVNTIYFI